MALSVIFLYYHKLLYHLLCNLSFLQIVPCSSFYSLYSIVSLCFCLPCLSLLPCPTSLSVPLFLSSSFVSLHKLWLCVHMYPHTEIHIKQAGIPCLLILDIDSKNIWNLFSQNRHEENPRSPFVCKRQIVYAYRLASDHSHMGREEGI